MTELGAIVGQPAGVKILTEGGGFGGVGIYTANQNQNLIAKAPLGLI